MIIIDDNSCGRGRVLVNQSKIGLPISVSRCISCDTARCNVSPMWILIRVRPFHQLRLSPPQQIDNLSEWCKKLQAAGYDRWKQYSPT